MSNRGLSIGLGIAQGLEKASANIYNIRQAKQELDMKKENMALDKRVKETLLKKYEFDPDFDPETYKMRKETLDTYYKAANALAKVQEQAVDSALSGNIKGYNELMGRAKIYKDSFGDSINSIGSDKKGTATEKTVNADEAIRRKVRDYGVKSLVGGEKDLWDRMGGDSTEDEMETSEKPSEEKPTFDTFFSSARERQKGR